jgi:hypothetical protein
MLKLNKLNKNYILVEDNKNNMEIIINKNGIFKCCYDYGDSLCELYKLNYKLNWIEVEEEECWDE